MENMKHKAQILFVDDEDKARKYFEKGLKADFMVLTAASVDEAIKILEQNDEIGVVITDQRMPGGNGVKLLNHLKTDYPHIIRLLTTAYSDLGEAIEAVNCGEIFRYIQKPWDFVTLKTELKQAMEFFEAKAERDELLEEKLLVRQKILKVERFRSFLLLSQTLPHIRHTKAAIQQFISHYLVQTASKATQEAKQLAKNKDFDMWGYDIAETLYWMQLSKNLEQALPCNENYGFEQQLKINDIASLVSNVSDKIKIHTSEANISIRVNQPSIEKLISVISKFVKADEQPCIANLIETTLKCVHNTQVAIGLFIQTSQTHSLFEQNFLCEQPQVLLNQAEQPYLELLVAYFIVYHHGGLIKHTKLSDELVQWEIYLPVDSQNAKLNQDIAEDWVEDILVKIAD